MKKALLLLVAALFAAAAALGALGDVVTSFSSPANYPTALAKSSSAVGLWVFCSSSPYRVYRLSATNGSLQSSFLSPAGANTCGLTFKAGSYLYLGNSNNDKIYLLSIINGSIYSSFPAGHDMNGGLALDADKGGTNPTALFSSGSWPSPYYIWRQNYNNGSIYSSFLPTVSVGDLAWDYKNKLIWGGEPTGSLIYAYNKSGSMVAMFSSPAPYPGGLAYYENYLWVSTGLFSQRIWKVHCPGNIAVEPNSLGKIKAIFR